MANPNNPIPSQRQQDLLQAADSALKQYSQISAAPSDVNWICQQVGAQPHEAGLIAELIRERLFNKQQVINLLQNQISYYESLAKQEQSFADQAKEIAESEENQWAETSYLDRLKRANNPHAYYPPTSKSALSSVHQAMQEGFAIGHQNTSISYTLKAEEFKHELNEQQQREVGYFTKTYVEEVRKKLADESNTHLNRTSEVKKSSSAASTTTVVVGTAIAAGALWLINKMRKQSAPSSNSSENDTPESNVIEQETLQNEKVIISCPNCPQNLRVPSNRGELTLTCPKCRHSWLWSPK